MADTNGPPPQKRVEVKVPFPNHVGRATNVFVIHMGIMLVGCVIIGILWSTTAMWVCGGFLTLFMVGWHINSIDAALRKDKEWKPIEYRYVDDY